MAVSPEAAKSSIRSLNNDSPAAITSCRLSAHSPVRVSPAPLSARRAVAAEAVSYAPAGASKSVAEPGYAPELGVASTHAQAGEASVSGSRAREQGSPREPADAPPPWRLRASGEAALKQIRLPEFDGVVASTRRSGPHNGRGSDVRRLFGHQWYSRADSGA